MSDPTPTHTYDTSCRLIPRNQPISGQDDPPPILARFFYSAPCSIDDPLSSGDLFAAASDTRNNKGQYRPFSADDNYALETAWLGLSSREDRHAHQQASEGRKGRLTLSEVYMKRLSAIARHLAVMHQNIHGPNYLLPDPATLKRPIPDGPEVVVSSCCPELYHDVETEISHCFCAIARDRMCQLSPHSVIGKVMDEFKRYRVLNYPEQADPEINRPLSSPSSPGTQKHTHIITTSPFSQSQPSSPTAMPSRGSTVDDGITGKPFIRADSPGPTHASRSCSAQRPRAPVSATEPRARISSDQSPRQATVTQPPVATVSGSGPGSHSHPHGMSTDVVVGVSRLHMVSLPTLCMQPIYWSPVNDNAVVMRGTWFYRWGDTCCMLDIKERAMLTLSRDTMLPLPPDVANQLEAGYRELQPWTETWNDELKCAVEVGPLGEEKVSHQLWSGTLPRSTKVAPIDPTRGPHLNTYCAARCFQGEAASLGILNPHPLHITKDEDSSSAAPRAFANYHVIYRNARLAFLLKPSLKPSGYYGRRPVAKIMKGSTVGVPVVRGFDETAWDKYHHGVRPTERQPGLTQSQLEAGDVEHSHQCLACELERETPPISDLVLVIHGIGQKFAERVESFHFTHSINALRRSVNLELNDPVVKGVLRDENGTRIMVLPVNWRHGLSFEGAGSMELDKMSRAPDEFGLKDIEPPTIPAVRSMISDIMFDIPFYMSKHKPRMIHALVAEANRVYQRWCQNNPGFADNGRVHLIAHSLGSAMALDILSRQPSYIPKPDLSSTPATLLTFNFDTTNLFLVGSPAAFFLLLERATLMPRRGRVKPGAISSDMTSKEVVREAGEFGCLAVDNIYNVLAKEDPIAYLLNSTIDPAYAESLKTAYVPSTSNSLFQSMGSVIRSLIPGVSHRRSNSATAQTKPSIDRLPSQLELEIHDFTREEIAEKKAYLLNDNGQLDYYLHSGGGPLEIQYLNMLGAHSSYWTHQDFVRMLCMEIGRKPGRENTLPAMRAVKAATQKLAPAPNGHQP